MIYRTWPAERIDALAEAQRREGTYYGPEQIGTLTGVTQQAYVKNRFQAICPAGMTEAQRVRDQLDHKAAWQRADNLAKGKVKKPHALSLKRTKPWMARGISESTWKKRRREGKLEAGACDCWLCGPDLSIAPVGIELSTFPGHVAA